MQEDKINQESTIGILSEMAAKRYKEARVKTDVLLIRFNPGEREMLLEFALSQGFSNLSSWARMVLRKAAKLKLTG